MIFRVNINKINNNNNNQENNNKFVDGEKN